MNDAIGPQKRQPDPRGWLCFDHLPPEIQAKEDSRLMADRDQVAGRWSSVFTREATATEHALLEHLGYVVPEKLDTRVEWLSPGVRNRRWLALEGEQQ